MPEAWECSVCFEAFNETQRTPLLCPAGHSTCKFCYTKIRACAVCRLPKREQCRHCHKIEIKEPVPNHNLRNVCTTLQKLKRVKKNQKKTIKAIKIRLVKNSIKKRQIDTVDSVKNPVKSIVPYFLI